MSVTGVRPERETRSSPPLLSNFPPWLPPFLPSCALYVFFVCFFPLFTLLPLLLNSFPLLNSAGELDERTSATLWEVLLSNMTDSTLLLRKWIQLKADTGVNNIAPWCGGVC